MSTQGDDFFDWDALEAQMSDVTVSEPVAVTTLTNEQLLHRFEETTEQLRLLKQMIRPSTQEGRDLHSERAALRIELANRNLL